MDMRVVDPTSASTLGSRAMLEEYVWAVLISEDLSHLPANFHEFVEKMVGHIAGCSKVLDWQQQQISFRDLAQRGNDNEVVGTKQNAALLIWPVELSKRILRASRKFVTKVASSQCVNHDFLDVPFGRMFVRWCGRSFG